MSTSRYVALLIAYGTAASGGGSSVLRGQEAVRTAPLLVIGIVEVPRLHSTVRMPAGHYERLRNTARVELRKDPVSTSPVVTVASLTALEAAEFTYEESGPLVYARERDWSLVRTAAGVTGWLAPADTGRFHPLEELLKGLSHLTDAWDRRLAKAPGAVNSDRTSITRKRPSVRLLSFRRVAARLWAEVEVMSHSFCASEEPKVEARGWIAVHDPSGKPTIWFSSRGC